MGSSEDRRGPQGSAVLERNGDISRPLRRKRTRAPTAAHVLKKSPILQVQVGIREALPHKKRSAV